VVQVDAVDAEGGDDDRAQDLEDNTTQGWDDPVPVVPVPVVVDNAAEWKRKYEELLAAQQSKSSAESTEPAVATQMKQKRGPPKSAPEPLLEEERQQQRAGGSNKKKHLTLKQIKAIQRQSVRMERYHQSEMDSAARDTLVLAGADSDGDY
jgi:hypothetical protein